jgi:hypothetical protein
MISKTTPELLQVSSMVYEMGKMKHTSCYEHPQWDDETFEQDDRHYSVASFFCLHG